ncbi:chloride channel protein [Chitinophaga rhizophila]|uniref:Chloride channel protein n=1 Tax=Chitinophaga rhizophila TaxID=2866212 RepID=A0ABS7GGT0_9BACT|nr:chloride channel protein [Chitinophaga rhizophila]MBW8685877.1 chloride channel protein [Chitinophaga rhizophila]
MKANFLALMKNRIPFSEVAGKEIPTPDQRISGMRALLMLVCSVALAAATSLLLYGLLTLMNAIPVYSGLPGESRYLQEQDILILIVPVITALIISCLLHYTGNLSAKKIRPIQSILMICSGIPLGLEGPLTDMPFSISTSNSRRIHILSVACMTAGLAFLFGAPLMAVALSIELLIVELTWLGIIAAIAGGGTGFLLRYMLIGETAIWSMPDVPSANIHMLLGYIVAGVLAGLLVLPTGKLMSLTNALFQRLPLNKLWWPVLAAGIVGITGYYLPETFGAGYDHIEAMLNGQITLQFLVIMMIGKLVLMAIVIASGIPGGTMAPLIVAGGAAGIFITFLLQFAFPGVHLHVAVAALVGMSAMFSAGNRVLLSAILFAIETTHALNALLPVICACTAAYTVVYLLTKRKTAVQSTFVENVS